MLLFDLQNMLSDTSTITRYENVQKIKVGNVNTGIIFVMLDQIYEERFF